MVVLLLFLILLAIAWPYFALVGWSLNANLGAVTILVCVLYVYFAWKQRGKASANPVEGNLDATSTKPDQRVEPK
jgi:apolipoprotein N-acyltransferase